MFFLPPNQLRYGKLCEPIAITEGLPTSLKGDVRGSFQRVISLKNYITIFGSYLLINVFEKIEVVWCHAGP